MLLTDEERGHAETLLRLFWNEVYEHGNATQEQLDIIKLLPSYSVYYIDRHLKRRWPEAEPYILEDKLHVLDYYVVAVDMNEVWPEGDRAIIAELTEYAQEDPSEAARLMMKAIRSVAPHKWPNAALALIRYDDVAWKQYIKFCQEHFI